MVTQEKLNENFQASLNNRKGVFKTSLSIPSFHSSELASNGMRKWSLFSMNSLKKQSAQLSTSTSDFSFHTNQLVMKLETSKNQLKAFMCELNEIRNTILQQEVLSHISLQSHKFEKLNYIIIGEYVSERIRKMIKNGKFKQNWSENDIKILVWVVGKYCEWKKKEDLDSNIDEEDWNYISSIIPGSNPESCMFKWLSLRKSKVRDQKWLDDEKELLRKLVMEEEDKQKDWNKLAKKLYKLNTSENKIFRCGKQCREHWNCFLNPKLKKANWTSEEDVQLLQAILKEKLKKKWAKLSQQFDGRTENALKNRYSILIEKQIKSSKLLKKASEQGIIRQILNRYQVDTTFEENNQKVDSQKTTKTFKQALKIQEPVKEETIQINKFQVQQSYEVNEQGCQDLMKLVKQNPGKFKVALLQKKEKDNQ